MTQHDEAGSRAGPGSEAGNGILAARFARGARAAHGYPARDARHQYDSARHDWLQITFATQDAELWTLPRETRRAKARAHETLLQAAAALLAVDPSALPGVRFVRCKDPHSDEPRRLRADLPRFARKSAGDTPAPRVSKATRNSVASDRDAEPVLLAAMEKLEAEGRLMGIGGGETYLPNLIVARVMNRGFPRSTLGRAMRRLLRAGAIRLVVVGRTEHRGPAHGLRLVRGAAGN